MARKGRPEVGQRPFTIYKDYGFRKLLAWEGARAGEPTQQSPTNSGGVDLE